MPEHVRGNHEQDLEFVQRVLDADSEAANELRRRYEAKLVAVLCSRGANRTEAEDLVADLWADCFAARGADRSLLVKYQGRATLESWLTTVAMHRLVDLKRRQTFRVEIPDFEGSSESFFERTPQSEAVRSEGPLLDLLREAVRRGFAKAHGEDLLMLKLVHLYQLTQREVGRMWGWHESKVSRTLERARGGIATEIMMDLKRSDPWLELQWDDFVELCERSADLLPVPGENISQARTPHESKVQSHGAMVG
ncbi:MAG TPA: sigma-70 family RNA polymerase sigma factor [Chthoniobacterales bacterium]|nr:sigma-70 family RNA polymerase sigma factor [Chthoniobacterales bacterium]